jgi:predicted nucleotidyltransferase
MKQVIKDKLEVVKNSCAQYGIKRLSIFGSVVGEKFNEGSDIDFLLAFDERLSIEEYTNNYFLFHDFLKGLFKREIDLVTENSLSNPYFIQSINQSKQIVYEA